MTYGELDNLYAKTYRSTAEKNDSTGAWASLIGFFTALGATYGKKCTIATLNGMSLVVGLAGVAVLVVGWNYISGFEDAFEAALRYSGDKQTSVRVTKEVWSVESGTTQGKVYETRYVFTALVLCR